MYLVHYSLAGVQLCEFCGSLDKWQEKTILNVLILVNLSFAQPEFCSCGTPFPLPPCKNSGDASVYGRLEKNDIKVHIV